MVVSLTVYHCEARDFIRGHHPDHDLIVLQCDPDELVRRDPIHFARMREYVIRPLRSVSPPITRSHTLMLPLTPRHTV